MGIGSQNHAYYKQARRYRAPISAGLASDIYVRLLVWEADVPLHQIERTGVRSRCAPSSDRKNCVFIRQK